MIASLSEVYTYDSLNQLASYKLGTLNGTKTDVTGSPSNSQSWDYDAVGNWDSVTTNSTTQTRTANKQNEITTVSSATTPVYDSNGNLTTDENNYRFVYDAWNKVVQVKNSSNVVIVTYGRDALHRHVTDTVGSTVTDRFFSSDWQLLETKVGSNTLTRNVWSPVYVDGLVLRDRDTDANGTLDERLYSMQDANWNTTALVNTSGTVQERYTYTPFGQVTFRDSTGSNLSNSAKDWIFLHQGGERIAAGDYEFRNRVYSPSLGRWLSNDPLGFEAGDVNWYRAIGNNPGNGTDFSGLAWFHKWEWHHMFPNEFKSHFPNFDFDASDNGRLVTGGKHRGKGDSIHALGWNEDWEKWLQTEHDLGNRITPESIKSNATQMMESEKYKKVFEGSKPTVERYNDRWKRLKKLKGAGVVGAAITTITIMPNFVQAAQVGGVSAVAIEAKQLGFELVSDFVTETGSSILIGGAVVGVAAAGGVTITSGGAAVTTVGGFGAVGGAVTVTAGVGYATGYGIGMIPTGGGKDVHDRIADGMIGALNFVGLW